MVNYLVQAEIEVTVYSKDKKESKKFIVHDDEYESYYKFSVPFNPYFNSFIMNLEDISIFEKWLVNQMEKYKNETGERIAEGFGFPLDRIKIKFLPKRVEVKKDEKQILIYSYNAINVIKSQQELHNLQMELNEVMFEIEKLEELDLNKKEKLRNEKKKAYVIQQSEKVEIHIASNIEWLLREGVKLNEVV